MTTEIVIMNQSSAAIASDSAVTIGGKVSTTADKIFTLSKYAPVGIMIFGNASFMGVPWEVIIKKYRAELDKKVFDKFTGYVDDFIRFLNGKNSLFPISIQDGCVKERISKSMNRLLKDIKNQIKEAIRQKGKITNKQIQGIIDDYISTIHKNFKNEKNLEIFQKDYEKKLKETYKEFINAKRKEVFQKLPMSKSTEKLIDELHIFIFLKEVFHGDYYSGVVITGYGEKEDFPSCMFIEFEIKVLNQVKYFINKHRKIGDKSISWVMPFAQREMIHQFMEGVHPKYQEIMEGVLNTVCNSYPKIVSDYLESKGKLTKNDVIDFMNKSKKFGNEILKDAKKELLNMRQYYFVRPTATAIASLTKGELAELAESLVYLTSLKKKMTIELQTVGGPIDVAIISKSDGFIWIKRKHYFKPELNPHFFQKYYKDGATIYNIEEKIKKKDR